MLTGKELGAAIEAARIAKGVNKKQLADAFGVKPPSVQGWVNTGRIDKSKLMELIAYFSDTVGPEHWGITGRISKAISAGHTEPGTEELRKDFASRIRQVLALAGIPEWGAGARLAEVTGATAKAASKWLNAESMPGRANMLAIAEWLGVRVEWLQYGEGEPHQAAGNPPRREHPEPARHGQAEKPAPAASAIAGLALFEKITPRSRALVDRILEMEAKGALTDEDLKVLTEIVERFGSPK